MSVGIGAGRDVRAAFPAGVALPGGPCPVVVLVWIDEHGSETLRAGDLRTDGVDDLVRTVIDATARPAPTPPWGTYLAVHPDTRQVLGTCGFRGEPNAGRVEIAFWTFPPFEGRGWATAMTRELVALAGEHPEVHMVVAHTLPERDPSTSVLRANGLRNVSTVRRDITSPEGGTAQRGRAWRWELHYRTV